MSWLDDALPGTASALNVGDALKHFLSHLHNAIAFGNPEEASREALARCGEVAGALVANTDGSAVSTTASTSIDGGNPEPAAPVTEPPAPEPAPEPTPEPEPVTDAPPPETEAAAAS